MPTSNFEQLSQKSQQSHAQSNKKLVKKQANILFQFQDDDDSDNNSDQIQIEDLSINEFQKTQNKRQAISKKNSPVQKDKSPAKNSSNFFQQKINARNQSPSKIIQIQSEVISISPSRFKKKRQMVRQQQISQLRSQESSQPNQYIIVQKPKQKYKKDEIRMESSSYNLYPQFSQTVQQRSQLSSAQLRHDLRDYAQKKSPERQFQKQSSPQKLFVKFHSKNLNQSILTPNQKQLQASQIYSNIVFQKLKEQSSKQKIMEIHKFTTRPLQGSHAYNYVRFTFQVHIYKYYFSTDYQLWLRNADGQLLKLLKAEKDPLGYRSSCLMIYQMCQTQNKNQQKIFAGKLNYNITKNEYHLYDIDEITHPDKPRQMIATIFYTSPYANVQRGIQLFIPKSQYYDHDFIRTQEKRNLLAFKQTEKVSQMKSHKIKPQQMSALNEQFQLKKSLRILSLQDETNSKKLFIGKMQTNRYVMVVGRGITPIQAFATAIVNFQH